MYKTLTAQTIHYFSRPHERVLRTPLDVPAAWKGRDVAARQDWREVLGPKDIGELERAIAFARKTGKATRELERDDFPLARMASRIARWRRILMAGRGFVVVRGVPVERWDPDDTELFYWCFGLHMGRPGAQNPRGDLLGHVIDTGQSPDEVRHYQTRVHIQYHCDAADIVGLLCLSRAARGGLSRIVSSVSVYNELLGRRPDLVDRLYEPFMMDTKGEGGVAYLPVRPCAFADGQLRTFYHADYFRSAQVHAGAPPLTADERTLLDLYDEVANSPELYLDLALEPGDIELLSNHTQLHARTAYEDPEPPAPKRHLLRLWISIPSRIPLSTRLRRERSRLEVLGVAARYKLENALRRRAGS